MTDTDDRDDDLGTLHAIYRIARHSPQPATDDTVNRLLPNADDRTTERATDAATLGAIHGVTDTPALSKAELEDRLAATDRDSGLLYVETGDEGEPESEL